MLQDQSQLHPHSSNCGLDEGEGVRCDTCRFYKYTIPGESHAATSLVVPTRRTVCECVRTTVSEERVRVHGTSLSQTLAVAVGPAQPNNLILMSIGDLSYGLQHADPTSHDQHPVGQRTCCSLQTSRHLCRDHYCSHCSQLSAEQCSPFPRPPESR